MQTEEQIRKTQYAKALNRIAELELIATTYEKDLERKESDINDLQEKIYKLESQVEDLEFQMEDRAMFKPDCKMSLIELMELESVVGEITLY